MCSVLLFFLFISLFSGKQFIIPFNVLFAPVRDRSFSNGADYLAALQSMRASTSSCDARSTTIRSSLPMLSTLTLMGSSVSRLWRKVKLCQLSIVLTPSSWDNVISSSRRIYTASFKRCPTRSLYNRHSRHHTEKYWWSKSLCALASTVKEPGIVYEGGAQNQLWRVLSSRRLLKLHSRQRRLQPHSPGCRVVSWTHQGTKYSWLKNGRWLCRK